MLVRFGSPLNNNTPFHVLNMLASRAGLIRLLTLMATTVSAPARRWRGHIGRYTLSRSVHTRTVFARSTDQGSSGVHFHAVTDQGSSGVHFHAVTDQGSSGVHFHAVTDQGSSGVHFHAVTDQGSSGVHFHAVTDQGSSGVHFHAVTDQGSSGVHFHAVGTLRRKPCCG